MLKRDDKLGKWQDVFRIFLLSLIKQQEIDE